MEDYKPETQIAIFIKYSLPGMIRIEKTERLSSIRIHDRLKTEVHHLHQHRVSFYSITNG
ncbi:MAG: hypothetical protein MJZ99_04155 [Bacteroidales bacterium]|nr:hypothetical protein [Bacteroidales bacterium]